MVTALKLRPKVCVAAALALLAAGPPVLAVEDCIDNERIPIASGGTNGVVSVFAIDVDGDTDIDVLTASTNDDKIAWYENDGTPDWAEHVISTNADGASSVYAGDLDGDGDTDVVSASANDDKIAWYENDGGERFIERAITTDALNASAVAILDIDGVNGPDVLSASINDDTVAWYANDGQSPPSFTETLVDTAANGASSVFAAEIFADAGGHMELLSASRLDDTISWYERTEDVDAEMNPIVVYVEHVIDNAADGAASVYAGDMDGDGDIDVLSASGNDHKISWYENLDDGAVPPVPPSFTKHVISAEANGAGAVFAADLDGDLDLDVLSASRFDDKIAWYENLGGGVFGGQQIITTSAPGAAAVYAIDLDQDPGATVDVVAVSSEAGPVASNDRIAWHENDGTPAFVAEHEISGGAVAPEALLAVDVDGDGDPAMDIVAASSVDDTISWYENLGGGDFGNPNASGQLITTDAPGVRDLFWADLDGDLDMDLLAALGGIDSIAWYENLGGGLFDPTRNDISSLQADGASSVFAIDLNGDGAVDVLSTSADDDRVSWYRNLGGGAFGPQINLTESALGAQAVFAKDLDGDGDTDVIAVSSEDDTVHWFESDFASTGAAEPGFTEHEIVDIGGTVLNGPRDLWVEDVDNDLDQDVVVVSAEDDRVTWFKKVIVLDDPNTPEDESDEFWDLQVIFNGADFVREVVAVDMEGDGDIDVVSASSGDDSVRWHQSDGNSSLIFFDPRDVSSNAESVRAIAVADVNGDSSLDIVTGFFFEIAWHPGNATEICDTFDVALGGDGEIDGQELALLGALFGQFCIDPPPTPCHDIDYNGDGQVDGSDLAILTSVDVWGNSTTDCAFTCP